MDGLIHIVGEDLDTWDEETYHTNRYSIFTQNLMLADKVSKRQHLSPRSSAKFNEDDERSFHSAGSRPESIIVRADSPTIPEEEVLVTNPAPVSSAPPYRSGNNPANIGRPRTAGRRARQVSQSSSGDWTWRPSIPQRVSSMDTRRKKGTVPRRPDLATFHRRSCQLFSSLDTTLSSTTRGPHDTDSPDGSRTSTSPSLASSISTQATSVLDDGWYGTPGFPSFHLELHDPARGGPQMFAPPDFGDFMCEVNHTPKLGARRSSSQLSPDITTTEPIFWTSDRTREREYAKIDAAHSGFRGFVKRMLPRSWGWAHGKRRNFYQKPVTSPVLETPVPDTDSVRRYRMSLASATQEAIRGAEEHGVSRVNSPVRCLSPSMAEDDTVVDLNAAHSALTGLTQPKPMKANPVNKVLAKVRSSDALAKMFRSSSTKVDKAERRSKTLSRDFGY